MDESFEALCQGVILSAQIVGGSLTINGRSGSDAYICTFGDSAIKQISQGVLQTSTHAFAVLRAACVGGSSNKVDILKEGRNLSVRVNGPQFSASNPCIFGLKSIAGIDPASPTSGTRQEGPIPAQFLRSPSFGATGSIPPFNQRALNQGTGQGSPPPSPTQSRLRRSSVITLYKHLRKQLTSDESAAARSGSIESLNLELSLSPSPKLNFSQELSRMNTLISSGNASSGLDSPRLNRRGTVAGMLRSSSKDLSSSPTYSNLFGADIPSSPRQERSQRSGSFDTSLTDITAKLLFFDLRNLTAVETVPGSAGVQSLEIHVALSSAQSCELLLTEPFIIQLPADGRRSGLLGSKGLQGVFRDLPSSISEICLIIRVFAVCTLQIDGKPTHLIGRRPYAASAVLLSTISPLRIVGMDALEVIQLYSCAEDKFWQLPDLVRKRSGEAVPLSNKSVGICVCALPDPSLLQTDTSQIPSFPAAAKAVRLLADLPHILPLQATSNARQARNDVYATLKDLSFNSLKKQFPLEVTIRVEPPAAQMRRGAGVTVTKDEPYSTFVLESQSLLHFDEMICVSLPPDAQSVVLHIMVTKLSKKKKKRSELGKGSIVIVDSAGNPQADGERSVPIQAREKMLSRGERELASARIKTRLVSNRISTNTHLSRLRQWRVLRLDELQDVIRAVSGVAADVLSVINETFDSLFAILDSVDNQPISLDVGHTLVSLINFLAGDIDKRGLPLSEPAEAINRYFNSIFSGLQHPCRLMLAVSCLLTNPITQKPSDILPVIRALPMLLKALSASKVKGAPEEAELTRKLAQQLVSSIAELLASPAPDFQAIQGFTCASLYDIVQGLRQSFSASSTAAWLSQFLQALKTPLPSMVRSKLGFVHALLNVDVPTQRPVLADGTVRRAVWPSLVAAVIPHLSDSLSDEECKEMSISALHMMIEMAQKACSALHRSPSHSVDDAAVLSVKEDFSEDVNLLFSLFTDVVPVLVAALPPPASAGAPIHHGEAAMIRFRHDIAIAILTIFYITPVRVLLRFLWVTINKPSKRTRVISSSLEAIHLLMQGPGCTAFPSSGWDELILFQYRTSHTVLMTIGSLLKANNAQIFTDEDQTIDMRTSIFRKFFQISLEFLLSPQLQLELMPDGRRAALLHRCGDLRVPVLQIANEVLVAVRSISSGFVYSTSLAESCIAPLALLSVNWRFQDGSSTSKDIICAIFADCGKMNNLTLVRTGLVALISRGMAALIRASAWTNSGQLVSWIESILPHAIDSVELKLLAQLSFDLEQLPSTGADVLEEKAVRLCRVIRAMDAMGYRYECVRDMFRLAEFYSTRLNSPVAAAFVYSTLSQMLPWDDASIVSDFMDGEPRYSFATFTHSTRKERVIRLALDNFTAGSMWHDAYLVSKQLTAYYESTWNYFELDKLLQKQTSLLRGALHPNSKFSPTFWFIGFCGNSFPMWLRGKQFVQISYVQQQTWADLSDKLRTVFPGVKVVNTISTSPEVEYSNLPGVIQAIALTPITEERRPSDLSRPASPTSPSIPTSSLPSTGKELASEYRATHNVSQFRCTVHFENQETDFFFKTEFPFGPSLEMRIPVLSYTMSEPRQLPPLRIPVAALTGASVQRVNSPPPFSPAVPLASNMLDIHVIPQQIRLNVPQPASAPGSRSNSPMRQRI